MDIDLSLTDSKHSAEISRGKRCVLLLLLFGAAFGLRLWNIDHSPWAIREIFSCTIVRGYYFEHNDSLPQWRRQIAERNWRKMHMVEPRVMERLTFWGYCLLGGEYFWFPRLISVCCWIGGGFFVYLLCLRVFPFWPSLVSAAFYLFLPYGIVAGRCFQPDPMMVMFFAAALYGMLRYLNRPSRWYLIFAAFCAGAAIFVKLPCLFLIFGAIAGLFFYSADIRKLFLRWDFILFYAIALAPAAIYYGSGLLFSGFSPYQTGTHFKPYLLLEPSYWLGWLAMIGRSIGLVPFLVGLLGVFVCPKGLLRGLLVGLWIGYIIYGLVFSYAIHTHAYYQLPFVPVIAIGLCSIASLIFRRFRFFPGWRLLAVGLVVVTIGSIFFVYNAANGRYKDFVGSHWQGRIGQLSAWTGCVSLVDEFFVDNCHHVEVARQIGDLLGHSAEVLILADRPLANFFHCEISGLRWPTERRIQRARIDGKEVLSAERWLDRLRDQISAKYFVVANFCKASDIGIILKRDYEVFAEGDGFVIYDITAKKD